MLNSSSVLGIIGATSTLSHFSLWDSVMPSPLAEQFQSLWKSNGSSPDVFAFLEQHVDSKPEAKLAVLRCDQQHRWKTDQPLKVEEYFARIPDLAEDSDCKLELAVGEFQARQNGSTTPSIEEFVSRFPDISDTLRKKLSESATSKDAERPQPKVTPTETFDTKEIQQRMGRYRLLRDSRRRGLWDGLLGV